MSWQDSTKDYKEIGSVVQQMVESDIEGNVEILVYLNDDGKWIITKDRRFFSNGYKLEDVIVTQQEEIKKLHNEIASLKSAIGQLQMQSSAAKPLGIDYFVLLRKL